MLNINPGIIDFHSHILPGVDDGADSVETSLQMLGELKSQGVTAVLASSHYYNSHEDVASFVSRRDEALYRLGRHINEHDMDLPEIIPAAEVRLYPGMHKDERLSDLCIEGTRTILVEMPYMAWSGWMYNEIYALITCGYQPVMAHLERFISVCPQKDIQEKLLAMKVYVQCNADSFFDRKYYRFIKKLIKLGRLTVIGSDSHNMINRKPNIYEAAEFIGKKYGEEYLDTLMQNAVYLMSGK